MIHLISKSNPKHWLILGFAMLMLLVTGYLVVKHDINKSLEGSVKLMNLELNLLSTLTNKLLQSGEYDEIQPIFDEWAENFPHTQTIILTSIKNYQIAKYHSSASAKFPQTLTTELTYGYRGQAKLLISKNVDWVYTKYNDILIYALIIWFFIGFFGIYVIINLHIHEKENKRLERLSQKLTATNSKLQEEQSLLRSLIDSIPDLIFFKDINSVYLGCNKAFEKFLNKPKKDPVGKTDFDFFDKELAAFFRSNDKLMMKASSARRNEEWVTYPDGNKVLLDTLKTPFFGANGEVLGLIGVSRDMTEINQYRKELEELAYHDPLTNLPNRRFLLDQIHLSIANVERHQHKLAICSLDLDGFKEINDKLGHEAGDKVLIEFSNRISNALRSEDIMSRWGGDEFTILFNQLKTIHECIELIERLQKLIAIPFNVDSKPFNLSASIGITIFPDDNKDADTLLRHADQAMYQAKVNGKNCYQFFDAEQNKLLHEHFEHRLKVKQAIANNELELYYQPQVHMRKGAPYGVEALVRWNHPKKGVLTPIQFLPFIEDHIISVELDWWVINNAIAQLQSWLEHKNYFHLSINVSAITFKQADFVAKLIDVFNCNDKVMPQMISLELLETSDLGNLEKIASKMRECQEIGVQFSLDDFGTGYSSLTYLSKLPADILKIDQTFIRDMLVDKKDASIVEGIVGLSTAFDRIVIAEGVEEILQGNKLIEMGCRYAQGYAIAKPMQSHLLENWLTHFIAPEEWLQASNYPMLKVSNA